MKEHLKPILSAKNIHKIFSVPVELEILKGISLNLYPGESVAIMGASGEGKSTLLHILGTLESPTSGELTIAGKSVQNHPSPTLRNQHIGFVFQAFHLLEDYTVLQNVLMPALIAGKEIHKRSLAHARAIDLLHKVGLEQRIDYPAKHLSGGEKQRTALARALCNDPQILLADEPSGNLDHSTSYQIQKLLFNSVREFKKSLLVVTHDSGLASACDRTLSLCDGQLYPRKKHE